MAAHPSAALATDVASEDERFISDRPRFGPRLHAAASRPVGIGNQVSVWLTAHRPPTFPAYIGAMLVAVVVLTDGRRTCLLSRRRDRHHGQYVPLFACYGSRAASSSGSSSDQTMPMVICLDNQCCDVPLLLLKVVFNVMGRNYDAAVMTTGFIGFAAGARTSNAAACRVRDRKIRSFAGGSAAIPMVEQSMFVELLQCRSSTANIGW